ncbi:MAG: MmcQ/YjbR family DNA-binding protein [Deltaproteobacteria bacterium]|nr:MmcQ/YjbR family DNA-binding protein [Deltaproteobacteria bacterium]
MVTRLARLCLALPESYQETAWVGTRWMIRKRTFAHVVAIAGGWPPAYARAAGSLGPLTTPVTVLTVRAAGALYETLRSAGAPYFQPAWGTRWGAHVIGMVLAKDVDWDEVALVLTESYRLLAPRKLAASLR